MSLCKKTPLKCYTLWGVCHYYIGMNICHQQDRDVLAGYRTRNVQIAKRLCHPLEYHGRLCMFCFSVSLSPYIAGELMSSLNLSGPCITTDTACSSSMAALNMAVQDIQSGACKYAIVAGRCLLIN